MFTLQIPIKEFFSQISQEENIFEKDLFKRKINYMFHIITIENKKIKVKELIIYYEGNNEKKMKWEKSLISP